MSWEIIRTRIAGSFALLNASRNVPFILWTKLITQFVFLLWWETYLILLSQLCVWGMDSWDKQTSKFLQIPPNRMPGSFAETKVQFHQDQVQFLVVHESQIAIYEATKLDCLKQVTYPSTWKLLLFDTSDLIVNLVQWIPRDVSVTHATYSCDSQMIYATFTDGSVSVFTSALRLRCRISPMAYLKTPPRFYLIHLFK